jgi:urocanate hydratase
MKGNYNYGGKIKMIRNNDISKAMTIQLEEIFEKLPEMPEFVESIRRAPKRKPSSP